MMTASSQACFPQRDASVAQVTSQAKVAIQEDFIIVRKGTEEMILFVAIGWSHIIQYFSDEYLKKKEKG